MGASQEPADKEVFGIAEIKCPYKYCNVSPKGAATNSDFCAKRVDKNSEMMVQLKRNHDYFCQIQGQLAITGHKWCDFVLFTNRAIAVERIQPDPKFWTADLLPKVMNFYNTCFRLDFERPGFESQLDLKFFLILPCRYVASGPVFGGLIAPAGLFRLCLGMVR